jgi:uncharacterized membrane protein
MWGILPIYWKMLNKISPSEILINRIIWSFISLFILNTFFIKKDIKLILFNKKNRIVVFMTGLVVSINWGIFIYAIGAGKTVEASFGYYINPIVSIIFGILLHSIEMPLSAIYDIPHGKGMGIVIPAYLELFADVMPERWAKLARRCFDVTETDDLKAAKLLPEKVKEWFKL